MKSPSILVNKDAYDKDKKFSLKITCPALELINIQDGNIGLHLQVPRGGTHPNGVGSELTKLFFCSNLFFVTVGSHICTHFILVHMHRMAQGVAARVS